MKVQRGDVVLVDFPYSDRTGRKVRPALVVQSDTWNQPLDDTILAMVSSSNRRRIGAATQHLIAASSPVARGAGLRMDSVIQCENLVTYDQALILRVFGWLPDSEMKHFDNGLKTTRAIP